MIRKFAPFTVITLYQRFVGRELLRRPTGTEQRNKPLPPFHRSTPLEIGIVIGYRVACNRDYTSRIENLPLPTTDYSVPTAGNTMPSPATAGRRR